MNGVENDSFPSSFNHGAHFNDSSPPSYPLASPQTQKFEHPALLINISLTLMCAIVHTFYGPSFDEWMDTDG